MHLERHLKKTDHELILRLLSEWKTGCGQLNDNIIPYIEEFNNTKQEKEIILSCSQIAGYGYNRKFEKIETSYVKLIYDNEKLLTAYPEIELGFKTGEKYDFEKNKEILYNLTKNKNFKAPLYDTFLYLLNNTNYIVRYDYAHKNPKISIYNNDKKLTIYKNFSAKLETSTKINNNIYINKDNLIESINNQFKEHNIFELAI